MSDEFGSKNDFWKILNRTTIYECTPFLRLEKQTVELPDGRVIDDYHRLDMPEYSVICPHTPHGKIIILRAYRHGIHDVTYFLPGGFIDEGESPETAARRELVEETGYCSETWRSMGSYIPHSNYGCGRVHLFKAESAYKIKDPDTKDLEQSSIEVIDVETALKWITEGRIVSLSTVTAISLGLTGIFDH